MYSVGHKYLHTMLIDRSYKNLTRLTIGGKAHDKQ